MQIDVARIELANDRAEMKRRLIYCNKSDTEFAKTMTSAFGNKRRVYASVSSIVSASFDVMNLAEDLLSCVSETGRDAIREQIGATLADMAISTWALGGFKNAQIDTDAALNTLENFAK